MHIKITMRYHFTPVRMSIIDKSTHNKCWQGYGEKGTFVLLVGMQTGAATVENSTEFPQKTKDGTSFPSSSLIPLLGLYPKNPESPIQKNLCTPMFTAAQFTVVK